MEETKVEEKTEEKKVCNCCNADPCTCKDNCECKGCKCCGNDPCTCKEDCDCKKKESSCCCC